MRKIFMAFGGLLMSVLVPTVVMAQSASNVRPVPGSGAAYLYFPGESEGRVKLTISKEFGNMVQDRYAVYYRPQNKREELICREDEELCEKLLPAGRGRLRVEGYYDPAKKIPITHAKFNGACSTTGKVCNVNLRTSGTETVRITTGCNGSDYSVIELSSKDLALCVGPAISDKNAYLLAAHKNISAKRTKDVEEVKDAKSETDGKANTKLLLDNWAGSAARAQRESAAHYCNSLKLGEKNTRFTGWYVPAIKELDLALSGWSNKDQSFIVPKDATGYYSSTETKTGGRNPTGASKTIRWDGSRRQDLRAYSDAASVLCVYSVGQ